MTAGRIRFLLYLLDLAHLSGAPTVAECSGMSKRLLEQKEWAASGPPLFVAAPMYCCRALVTVSASAWSARSGWGARRSTGTHGARVRAMSAGGGAH